MRKRYFEWICDLIGDCDNYGRLLHFLFHTDFYYLMDMDGNRAEDGISLRYRYCQEMGIGGSEMDRLLNDRPCSMLEMMVALAKRCEDDIMTDSEIGNRTGLWFWDMISSLGLRGMVDIRFNRWKAEQIVDRFLEREYEPDGRGGLFYLPDFHRDLRNVEIWYQAMWFLSEFKE